VLQLTAGCVVGLWTGGVGAQTATGLVAAQRGEAGAQAEGRERRALSVGSSVYVSETIFTETDARLAITFGQKTILRLGANSKLRIDRYIAEAGGDFELVDGVLMFEHNGDPTPFEGQFRSPYGLIAVRGTRFYAGPSNGVFGVFVAAGRVEVTAGGQTVAVDALHGTDVVSPGARATEPKKWRKTRVAAMVRSVE
jgi:ferric-dicitrate binding protein FerR (iron transport regulator)